MGREEMGAPAAGGGRRALAAAGSGYSSSLSIMKQRPWP